MPSTRNLLLAADLFMAGAWELEPDEVEARLTSWLDESADKGAALRALHAAATQRAATAKAEAEAHTDLRRRAERVDARAKELMRLLLEKQRELGEEPKIPGVARLQRNGGQVPIVYGDGTEPPQFENPPEDFPPDLVTVSRSFNLPAIRAALETGREVPGFTLGERGEGVRWE